MLVGVEAPNTLVCWAGWPNVDVPKEDVVGFVPNPPNDIDLIFQLTGLGLI